MGVLDRNVTWKCQNCNRVNTDTIGHAEHLLLHCDRCDKRSLVDIEITGVKTTSKLFDEQDSSIW